MEYKKYTKKMIDFLDGFITGETGLYFFNLDYDGYVVDYFPRMEEEDIELAQKFADVINSAYENSISEDYEEEEFRNRMKDAMGLWLSDRDA